MALFKVLANDTRIRLLHHLVRSGEATVTDLAKTLGMKPQAVSNQLMRLSDTGMLASRRDGNNVYYRVVNGCVAAAPRPGPLPHGGRGHAPTNERRMR